MRHYLALKSDVIVPETGTFGRYTTPRSVEEEDQQTEFEEYEDYEEYSSFESTPSNCVDYSNQLNCILIALGIIAGMIFLKNIWD